MSSSSSLSHDVTYYLYVFVAVVFASALLKLIKRYWEWQFSPLWQIPGPTGLSFWFGSAWASQKKPFFHDHIKWVQDAGSNGKADMIHYTGILGDHSLLVLNCDLVQQILQSPAVARPNKEVTYVRKFPALIQMIGDGLITLLGENWHRHRRMLHPAFGQNFLRQQLTAVVPPLVKRLVECWKQTASRQVELDIASHFSMLTLDVIGRVGFSHDFHGMDSVEEWAFKYSSSCRNSCGDDDNDNNNKLPATQDKIVQSMNKSFSPGIWRMMLYVFGLNNLDWEGHKVRTIMNEAVDQVIHNARQQLKTSSSDNNNDNNNNNNKYGTKSILQLMMEAAAAQGGDDNNTTTTPLTDAELRDEIKTFIIAGHETTSTWCYWAIYLLTKHPDIQEKVYQDVLKHCNAKENYYNNDNDDDDDDDELTLEQIDKMEYLDAFLKEVLRLYPSVGLVIRHTIQPDTLNGVHVPTGTRINIPVFILHRLERYWDRPLECLPERWLMNDDNQKAAAAPSPHSHPYAYLPFSHGPRNCIGYRFAAIEVKLILAPLIRTFAFQLTPTLRDVPLQLKQRVSLRSIPEIKVLAQMRKR